MTRSKVTTKTLVVTSLMAILFSSNIMAKETNVWILRGLIRENAHSQFFFDRLKKEYPHINFHGLEVHGNGKYYREDSPTSIEKMVEQVRADYLKINECQKDSDNFLVAISLGGMIGVEWMTKNPEDFNKAIIMNSSLKGYSPIFKRMLPINFPNYAKLLLTTSPKEKEEIIYSMIISDKKRHTYLIEHWTEIRKKRPVSFSNTVRQILAGAVYTPPKVAPKTPVVIAVGLGDSFVDPICSINIAKSWQLPLVTHPTGGHDITNDQPEWVIKLIDEQFLSLDTN
ncbi:alpha/beta hydrolase [Bacteriovoracaceae bacterium]|nr:alpha/beta hydrolase [Bacteriovoracaceae bacterium]